MKRSVGIWLAGATIALSAPLSAQDLGIKLNAAAPAAAVQTLDGKDANLSKFIGKGPVLIEFWATWCENCKELEPTLKVAHEKYGSKVTFISVAVSVNQSAALVKKFVAAHKLPGEQFYDTKGDATDVYDVPATSYVVVLNAKGKVVYTGVGGKQDLDAALKKAM